LIESGNLQFIGASWSRRLARRGGSCLALLALLLQLATSFGHVHARDFASIGSGTTDGWHKTAVAKAATSPSGNLADDEDQCPICFSAFLLATSSVAHAEQLVAVFELGEVSYANTLAVFGLLTSGRAHFQSRAPPSA
jgi:DUF2946 family protein